MARPRSGSARRSAGDVIYEAGRVPLSRLHFDADNPRLPRSVNRKDESAVMKWMLEDATLLDLIGAIASEGYFPGEPVLVAPVREGKSPSDALKTQTTQFVVVEGNRRLAAVRLLTEPSLAPTRRRAITALARDPKSKQPPDALPVIAFESRVHVLDHVGFRHVTGVKAWSPLAKANYVEQLIERARKQRQSIAHEDIARMIGSKAWYVERLLTTRALVERLQADKAFFRSLSIEEDDLPFSLLLVALGRPDLVAFLGLRSANSPDLKGLKTASFKRLSKWLFKAGVDGRTALGESRNMTLLTQVVKNEDAMAALDKGEAIRTAAVLALDPTEILRVSVDEADRQLDLALRQRKRVKAVDEVTAEKAALVLKKAETLAEFASGQPRPRRRR